MPGTLSTLSITLTQNLQRQEDAETDAPAVTQPLSDGAGIWTSVCMTVRAVFCFQPQFISLTEQHFSIDPIGKTDISRWLTTFQVKPLAAQ